PAASGALTPETAGKSPVLAVRTGLSPGNRGVNHKHATRHAQKPRYFGTLTSRVFWPTMIRGIHIAGLVWPLRRSIGPRPRLGSPGAPRLEPGVSRVPRTPARAAQTVTATGALWQRDGYMRRNVALRRLPGQFPGRMTLRTTGLPSRDVRP